jgi:hypothetical protein
VGGGFTSIGGKAVANFAILTAPGISGTVYSDRGTTNIGANKTVALSINGAVATKTAETDSNGKFEFSGLNISSGDVVTLYLDGETEKAVTAMIASGESAASGIDLYKDHLIVRSDDTNGTSITNPRLATAANNGDTDISAIYTVDSGTVNVKTGKSLYVWFGDKFAPGGQVSVGGDFVARGSFDSGSYNVTVSSNFLQTGGAVALGTSVVTIGGNFDRTGGAAFDVGSSTIVFNTSQAALCKPLSANFYHVVINKSGGSLALNGNMDVDGDLTQQDGDFNVSTYSLVLAGNWVKSGGNLTASQASIVFNSTNTAQRMDVGPQTFNSIISSNTSAGGLTFVSSFTTPQLLVNASALGSAATIYFAVNSTFTI